MLFDSERLKQAALYRERQLRQGELDFCSSDYLGLSHSQQASLAFQQAFSTYPIGSGGSAVICGYHEAHQRLEQAFCEALDVESALIFNSGYVANLSVSALLSQLKLTLMIDKSVHASFYDGIKLSDGKYWRYPHQRYEKLLQQMKKNTMPSALVIESVFSIGGHVAPLEKISQFPDMIPMIVDEAHAFGLYGSEGLGRVHACGLTQSQVPLRIITFGKSFAAQGAIVVGLKDWIQALLQVSRGVIYSTASSPAFSAGLLSMFQLVREADEERHQLFENVTYFTKLTAQSPLTWKPSASPIQHLCLGGDAQALMYAERLGEAGVYCRAIRKPTVPSKQAGLRVVLHADHTFSQIERLMDAIHQVVPHDTARMITEKG